MHRKPRGKHKLELWILRRGLGLIGASRAYLSRMHFTFVYHRNRVLILALACRSSKPAPRNPLAGTPAVILVLTLLRSLTYVVPQPVPRPEP